MSIFSNVVETWLNNEHQISFVVQGKAQVQQRPKIAFRNRKTVIYYDPSSKGKKQWKKNFQESLEANGITAPLFGSDPLIDKGVHLSMNIYIPRPSNDFHVVKGVRMEKIHPHLYPNKTDIDNMVKFYMDAMQDVAYKNDNVITKLTCSKEFIYHVTNDIISKPYIVIKMSQLI